MSLVSIIVPVLNEASGITAFLRHLRENAPAFQIIVADGGSSDGTPELAEPECDLVVRCEAGRAVQMNAGARRSSGDILWFIHADTRLDPCCVDELKQAMEDPETVGGFFRIRLLRKEWIYRVTDALAHHAGLIFRIRCGDHAIFCRRSAFEFAGGYPEVPLMEDVGFYRLLLRQGKVRALALRVITSARRFEEMGAWRITAAYSLIMVLYVVGVSPARLAFIYQTLCVPRAGARSSPQPVSRD